MSAASTARYAVLDTASTTLKASTNTLQTPSPLKRKRSGSSTVGYSNLLKIETSIHPRSSIEADVEGESPRTTVSMNLSALHLRSDRSDVGRLDGSESAPDAKTLENAVSRHWFFTNADQAPAGVEEEEEMMVCSGRLSGALNIASQADAANTHTMFTASDAHDANASLVIQDSGSLASDRQLISEGDDIRYRTSDPFRSRENPTDCTMAEEIRAKPSPFFAITNDLVWSDAEITGYDPDDPDDDGYGINGIGYKPTPRIAERRRLRRQQQIAEWNRQEDSEKRIRRREMRNKARLDAEAVQNQSVDARPPNCKKVRFLDNFQNKRTR